MIGWTRATSGRRGRRGVGGCWTAPNLTSMIDVVFLLMVFFMLVAQLSNDRVVTMLLPKLSSAWSARAGDEARAIVNVVPPERRAIEGGAYRLGTLVFDDSEAGIEGLTRALEAVRRREPAVRVVVRAGRAEAYDRVHPVLAAVSSAGIALVDLSIEPVAAGGGRG